MDDAKTRAARRRAWPIRKVGLDEEGAGDDLSAVTTPEERLAMMWPLAREAWSLAGGIPVYRREHTPGRIVRRGRPG